MKKLGKALKGHRKVSEYHLQKVKRLEKALKRHKKVSKHHLQKVKEFGKALNFCGVIMNFHGESSTPQV